MDHKILAPPSPKAGRIVEGLPEGRPRQPLLIIFGGVGKEGSGWVADPVQWKGNGPPAIREDYWDAMCDQWATQEYQSRSAIATQNQAKMPEASLHTSGSITFGCHKKRMEEEAGDPVAYTELFCRTHKRKESGEFDSERSKEVVESYEQQLIERHGDDSSQHTQFDGSAWLVAAGQPKKGRVLGFGTGMDAGGVINSTIESGCSTASYNYIQSPPPP
ncbi:hypothetical protein Taro_054130 [Colocasia esculenta]|uniref:Uncharacterized protein n=1 Tax=Colocasia esculenta TaxID=4460 RepID=A0A843XQ95_COLES|nr:hypothetical protein [Colocasia esculenta]